MSGRVVWKYALEATDWQTIEMPGGAEVLTVQVQHGEPVLWALVDPDNELMERTFRMAGTGHRNLAYFGLGRYVGTFQLEDGGLVFHVWEAA